MAENLLTPPVTVTEKRPVDAEGFVTDPDILAKLNETAPQQEEFVSDPAVLAKLNQGYFDKLLQIESGRRQLDTKGRPIVSKKGAIGAAQVMPSTAPEAAKLAGLPFDDKKYKTDIDYNIALGQAYFNKQLETFEGDPAKAAAAYNAGAGAVQKAIAKQEQTGKSWQNFIPNETKDYIRKLGFPLVVQMAETGATSGSFRFATPEQQRSAQMQQMAQRIEEYPQTYQFDPSVVKGAAAIGGIVGGTLGGVAGRGITGALKSAIGGGLESAAGAIAGQYYLEGKPENAANDLIGLGFEMASGGGFRAGAEALQRTTTSALGKVPLVGGELANIGKFILGGETEAQWINKRFNLGDARLKGGVATDIFEKGNKQAQIEKLTGFGIALPKDIPVEKGIRTVYDDTVDTLSKTTPFYNSAQALNINRELSQAVQAGLISKENLNTIRTVINSQNNPMITAKQYASRLDNLIHSPDKVGLSGLTEEGARVVKDVLSRNYDSYFTTNTNLPLYGIMKQTEESVFAAKARDSIPVLLDKKFKGESDAIEQALRNLAKSKEGSNDFKLALTSYIKGLPEKEVFSEFNRLVPYIQKTKVLSPSEIAAINKGVGRMMSKKGKAGALAAVTAKASILGALGAELERTDVIRDTFGGEPSKIKPFNM